jgi:Sec7-like guanine-nucleotide exchange factor
VHPGSLPLIIIKMFSESSNNSDSEELKPAEYVPKDRRRFLKLKFDGDTKRLLDTPADFDRLLQKVHQKFPAIQILTEQMERPMRVALLFNEVELRNSEDL